MLAMPTMANAASLDEILQEQKDTQNKIDSLQDSQADTKQQQEEKEDHLSGLQSQQVQLNSELERLDGEITTSKETLEKIKAQIETLTAQIETTKQEIATLEVQIAVKKETFKERLQIMYKNGDIKTLEVLLSSDGISDFLSRSKMMQSLAEYDRDLITSLGQDMDALAVKKNELNGQKGAVEIAKQNEETNLANLDAQQEEKNQLLSQVTWEADLTQEQMVELEAASQALDAQIAETTERLNALADEEDKARAEIAEQQRIAAEKAAAEKAAAEKAAAEKAAAEKAAAERAAAKKAASASSDSSNGAARVSNSGYTWPSTSYRISSYYGGRTHPVTGQMESFHRGVDIAAAYGTPIYATKSGTVTLARYNGTYGNCVKLDHDDNGRSLYGHMSRIAVSAGQHVEQGQIIGYVGSTGRSTGPHLHFELYRGNTLVNPLGYF